MGRTTTSLTLWVIVFFCVFSFDALAEQAASYDVQMSQLDYDWGVMACQNGDYESAVKLFQQAIRKNPAFAAAYLRLGYTFAAMGDSESAAGVHRTLKTMDAAMADQLGIMLDNLRTLGKFKMSVGKGGTATGRFSEYVE